MPRLIPSSASTIRPEVLPVDSVARDDFESHAQAVGSLSLFISPVGRFLGTLNESTPPGILPPLHPGELGATTHEAAITIVNPDHEAADTAPATTVGAPVKVMVVMATRAVPLGAQPLDEDVVPPALDLAGPVLNASYAIGAGNHGHFGVTDCGVTVGCLAAIVCGGGWFKERFTGDVSGEEVPHIGLQELDIPT